ncbi:hypothetical protein B0H11DRAFT_2252937 [Mycena galericulata]|nr:hypothetical protein B0H11DRAFT_2252937 [Mycena galericulata]
MVCLAFLPPSPFALNSTPAGYNQSGKLGQVNILNGIMGVPNAQHAMDYIRIIVEFISQPEYVDLIPMFGIVNEALVTTIGKDQITSLYGPQTYGGDCSLWLDSSTWNAMVKAGLMQYLLASMDAMQDWFFWTWKIANATDSLMSSPLWSYQLDLDCGWMPTDPSTSVGTCAALGVDSVPFNSTFSAWQTGGAAAGTIAPTAISSLGTYPPATISNVAAAALTVMPTYAATLTYIIPTPSSNAK